MISEEYSERLRDIRLEKGYTQASLAEACGLSRIYISRVERGVKHLTLENMQKISKVLEASPMLLEKQ